MFHTVMSLLSSFRIGVRIKQVIERVIRKTVVIALAVAVLLMAAAFALVVVYHILISIYGFTEIESAGIVAATLILIGVIALAILPFIGPSPIVVPFGPWPEEKVRPRLIAVFAAPCGKWAL